jgi:hypothetical protein
VHPPPIEAIEEGAVTSPSPISIDTRLLTGESEVVRHVEAKSNVLKQENERLLEMQWLEEANDRLQRNTARKLAEENSRLEQENARLEEIRKLKEAKDQLEHEKNELIMAENQRLKNDRAADSSTNHTLPT